MEHQNCMLLIPSLMRDGCRNIEYSTEEGASYLGRQTNVAATKYIIDQLARKGEKLDRILMVCSDEVIHQPILPEGAEQPITSLAFYQRSISAWAAERDYSDEQIRDLFVIYEQKEINPGDYQGMNKIQMDMKTAVDACTNPRLYLDYTGGQRDASMLLVFFARMLEFQGAKVEDVLYSKINQGGRTGRIESCMTTYRLFYQLDEYQAIKSGDTARLREATHWIDDDRMKQEIASVQKAIAGQKAGNYEAGISRSAAAGENAPAGKPRSMEEAVLTELVKKKPRTMPGMLREEIRQGNLKDAAQMVNVQGARMLVEAGLVQCPMWMKQENFKKLGQEFSPYARYYGTYLRFVRNMLSDLKKHREPEQFREACAAYLEDFTSLRPIQTSYGTVNDYLRREFRQVHPEIEQTLAQELVGAVQNQEITAAHLRAALERYETRLNGYLQDYITTGFPFGNIDHGYSHSFYREKTVWYENGERKQDYVQKSCSEEYLRLLKAGMERLAACPAEERCGHIEQLCGDPRVLADAFPPLTAWSLFRPQNAETPYGRMIWLCDAIRLDRNQMTHNGGRITQKIGDEIREKLEEFASFLPEE